MAKSNTKEPTWVYAGTEDILGAICTRVDYQEFYFEKDGWQFKLVQESEWDYCYCADCCQCNGPTYYMRVYKLQTG